jgi:hypothetical protein
MQNGLNISQLEGSLMKFGSKLQKKFRTQPFSLGQISLYHIASFLNEIFCSAQISQLLSYS